MRMVEVKNAPKVDRIEEQLSLAPMKFEDLQLLRSAGRVVIFCRGFCVFTFERTDRFSRNYCLVQLHMAGGIKLNCLSELFGLNYQYCSRVLSRFKEHGVAGLKEETAKRYRNREIINDKIGAMIKREREIGTSYESIAEKIRFLFKKKVRAESIRVWMCRQGERVANLAEVKIAQLEMEVGQEIFETADGEWHRNIYAGSMILYAMIERSCFLRPFDEYIEQDYAKRQTSSSARRVVLTLFFMHALRCKSIEQGKHLVGRDFCQIVGGNFLRLQPLRIACDEIVKAAGFDRAIEAFFRDMITNTERGDRIYYTDGHFSSYYGKFDVPKGWDPRRQMGFKGRNTVYLHNSAGENIYLFESATNTSLSNDIEKLVDDMEKLGMSLKRKTLIFDRGGYSQKCFCYLKNKKKMYFVVYLKHRKKERRIEEGLFKLYEVELENDEKIEYRIFEGERRWARCGNIRVVILLGDDGRQIPILTNNPYLRAETIIFLLSRRWREENCFKFMIEHFGVDLLTTYKTQEAPDKIIKRPNPERVAINSAITRKKSELAKLRQELAIKLEEGESKSMEKFCEDERQLKFSIKNVQVDIDVLNRQREKIVPRIEVNLRDANVIMAQKRRLFINAIKAMNYNAEKWLQLLFKKHHAKLDETLSLIRSLWRQPGRIREDGRVVEVELEPLDIGAMRATLQQVLEELNQTKGLRLPDGRMLRVKMMQ